MKKTWDDFWRAYEEIRLLREQNVKLLSDLAYEKEYVGVLEGEKNKLLVAHVELEKENKRLKEELAENIRPSDAEIIRDNDRLRANLRNARFDNSVLRNMLRERMQKDYERKSL